MRFLLVLSTLAAALSFGGCRGGESAEPPVVPIRNMFLQPRYNPQAESKFFADGRTMRPLVEGTVAREMPGDLTVETGRTEDNSQWLNYIPAQYFDAQPEPARKAFLEQGQKQYNIYCAPCHAANGDGDGMIAVRAKEIGAASIAPPVKFSEDRIKAMPDGQLYATITNGVRNMPAYKHNIPLKDRWAIVAYVRAMQMSK